jgi:hypothetical protein
MMIEGSGHRKTGEKSSKITVLNQFLPVNYMGKLDRTFKLVLFYILLEYMKESDLI